MRVDGSQQIVYMFNSSDCVSGKIYFRFHESRFFFLLETKSKVNDIVKQ